MQLERVRVLCDRLLRHLTRTDRGNDPRCQPNSPPGDILIIGTGLSKLIRSSTPEMASDWGPGVISVDPTPELLAWIWNQNLGAVASDALAFEAIDPANMIGSSGFLLSTLYEYKADSSF